MQQVVDAIAVDVLVDEVGLAVAVGVLVHEVGHAVAVEVLVDRIDDAVASGSLNRESVWSESIAVGDSEYVKAVRKKSGASARYRQVQRGPGGWCSRNRCRFVTVRFLGVKWTL